MTIEPKIVCWIFGTAYSGSSLLNLLLDGQPRVRGLGESTNLIEDKHQIWCSRCAAPIATCPLRSAIQPTRFYHSIFQFYSDCRVLIDSTKWWKLCVNSFGSESGISFRALILSKTPHEFAYSWLKRGRNRSATDGFAEWWRLYQSTLQAAKSLPQLGTGRFVFLTYRQLVDSRSTSVEEMCRFLGVAFEPERLARWWESDSHIIGGNYAVAAQTYGDRAFFRNTTYLDSKYVAREREIFRDEKWKADDAFLAECSELYREMQNRLDPLLGSLGHLMSATQISEIEEARSVLRENTTLAAQRHSPDPRTL